MTPPHPALLAGAEITRSTVHQARQRWTRAELVAPVGHGADRTPTSRLDEMVEAAILEAIEPYGFNVLSEEAGHLDRGSAVTMVIDPVDGTGNAASGVPISCFTAALAVDGVFVEGLTASIDTDERWWARRGEPTTMRPSGVTALEGAVISSIRPKGDGASWMSVARRAGRTRILGSSSFEAALVCSGRLDAFVDAGSDTHRIVDLAAAIVFAEASGAVVRDVCGRPFELDPDVGRRWSGIVAATPQLADEICAVVLDA